MLKILAKRVYARHRNDIATASSANGNVSIEGGGGGGIRQKMQ